MKYKKITALLGITEITMNTGVFGNKQSFAKMTQEDLEKIENALNGSESEDLNNKLKVLTKDLNAEKQKNSDYENAVEQALQHAGLKSEDNLVQSIALLGEKCKEYGESTNRHSFPENNGEDESADRLIDGYLNPNDEHNKILKII